MMALVLLPASLSAQAETLVLKGWLEYTDAPNALYHSLSREAFRLLDVREQKIATLQSAQQWRGRQEHVRRTMLELIGPLPEPAPLNAHVLKVLKKPGMRIEKIMYESLPHFLVTACLFLPEKTDVIRLPRLPARPCAPTPCRGSGSSGSATPAPSRANAVPRPG